MDRFVGQIVERMYERLTRKVIHALRRLDSETGSSDLPVGADRVG